MEVQRHYNPKTFLHQVAPLLDSQPGKYNLIRGVLNTLIHSDTYKTFYLFSVTNRSKLIGAALWTPPHPLQVSDLPQKAIAPMIKAITRCEDLATSLGGPLPSIDNFARSWADDRSLSVQARWDQGVYQLSEVSNLEPGEGCLRYATHLDLDLMTAWYIDFQREAFGTTNAEGARRSALRAIKNRTAFFWTVGRERVALAGAPVVSRQDRRIGPVYTPVIHRGKGYATSLVWTLSRAILDAGCQHCYLYTDLANRTSNSIYRKIGYQQIGEAAHIEFKPRDRSVQTA